jgi:outer membrane protein TolC
MRPEIMRDTVRIRAAETGIRIARTDGEPTFAISATGDYNPTISFQTPRQKTAALTATIKFPFYDGGATRSNIAKAKLERDSARTNLDATRTSISQAVRTDYLNLLTAAQEIASANSALEGAIAQRQLAQVRYEGQVGLYLEVTQAESALVSAENDQVGAVYDYFVALATFEDAMGTPSAQPDPAFVHGPLLAVIP